MKKLNLLLISVMFAYTAFPQQVAFPKDSVKTGQQQVAYYTAKNSATSKKLIIAIQGCYSNGNTFANEVSDFAKKMNANIVSIENKQKIFINTQALKDIIAKAETYNNVKYSEIYYLGFSCNAAAGIAYGLENDIRFKGIIAFMPAVDRIPFSYYRFNKTFCPIVIITGNKDFSYNANKKMVEILSKYNPKKALLIDIPGAEHNFNVLQREQSLADALNFIKTR